MPRIVSLIASATEIVYALGEIGNLVGRSHECDYPDAVKSLPVCTKPRFPVSGDSREIDRLVRETRQTSISIYEVFADVLERLQPTHILTQIQCDVCAVSLRDVEQSIAARLASKPKVVALNPDSLAGIWNDIRRVADALEIAPKGEALVRALRKFMQKISEYALRLPLHPTVACLEWLEPLMAAGNWTPELVEMAGGLNIFGAPGQHVPTLAWEQVLKTDPDVIIAMPCGFDLERTEREMYWLTERPRWNDLNAVRNRRVYLADGNQYFNRPGPRVTGALQIMASILHPRSFPATLRNTGWKPL